MTKGLIARCILSISAVVAVAVVLSAGWAKTFDPTSACAANEKLLIAAVKEYAYDNNELLPPMTSAAAFDAALKPFVRDANTFICPETGRPYVPNPLLDHQPIHTYGSAPELVLLQDAVPHSDGHKLMAYASGEVTQAGTVQGDPNKICLDNVHTLTLGLMQYLQDYDERFPAMDTPTHFRDAVGPYVRDQFAFTCPATGTMYQPNKSLSRLTVAAIANPYTTVLVSDDLPHADGFKTVGYADGHVTHGPVGQPSCLDNETSLGLAVVQYTHDYDEQLPPMDTMAHFRRAVSPYLRVQDAAAFQCPDNHADYVLNSALSKMSLPRLGNPSTTVLLKDPMLNDDGSFNTLYVDGHAQQTFWYVPKSLAIKPGNAANLLWSRADGSALISAITPEGALESSSGYGPVLSGGGPLPAVSCADNEHALGMAILQYAHDYDETLPPLDSNAHLDKLLAPYSRGKVVSTCPETDIPYCLVEWIGGTRISDLWPPSDQAILYDDVAHGGGGSNTLYVDGHVEHNRQTWPSEYSDVALPSLLSPSKIAVDASSNSGLVWNGYVPQLWTLTPTLAVANAITYGPFDGWSLTGEGIGPNGVLRLLWTKWDGTAALWTTNGNGAYVSDVRLGPIAGKSAVSMTVGKDNLARVLWAGKDGTATVSTVHPDGSVATASYGPKAGSSAVDILVDSGNHTRILWAGSNGAATLSEVSSAGIVSEIGLTAQPGYTVVDAAVGADGQARIIYRSRAGSSVLDIVKSNGSVVKRVEYPPLN